MASAAAATSKKGAAQKPRLIIAPPARLLVDRIFDRVDGVVDVPADASHRVGAGGNKQGARHNGDRNQFGKSANTILQQSEIDWIVGLWKQSVDGVVDSLSGLFEVRRYAANRIGATRSADSHNN